MVDAVAATVVGVAQRDGVKVRGALPALAFADVVHLGGRIAKAQTAADDAAQRRHAAHVFMRLAATHGSPP